MSKILAKAAVAAIALSFLSGMAVPVFADDFYNGSSTRQAPTEFDLGIDVTQLPQDVAGAKAYFAAQAPETQRVLLASCQNYNLHPADAEMPQTLVFCAALAS